ncbi:hypothetical protein KVR01_009330 [Diaporthe batatas]|uniref:uncharacterized protein n=1 Tax=Diaporthe batatas TaxID=748121 RepID=UPI001D049341|nr:uncharacterized protein KVR01_009330 [Diaporthe batatas]KAG8161066.1 hypothetical protein KVR01_009330 [Diaporthe batatas]
MTPKRHRRVGSVGEGARRSAKSAKTAAPESTATEQPEAHQLSENHQGLEITVSLRSAKKAERNDPKPLAVLQEERRQFLLSVGIVDPPPQPATGNTASENPPGPDGSVHGSSTSAEPGLAGGQQSALHGDAAGPAAPANTTGSSREGSFDEQDQDDDVELGDDQSDEDEHDSEDFEDSDIEDEFPWFEELDGLATLPTSSRRKKQRIGSCTAKLIRRRRICDSFWTEMDEPTRETHDLAFDLFDRYGRLNPEFYEHEVNKGTGVWGKELDRGDLLLFEEISVDAAHRRRGIGAKLVNAILERTRKKVSDKVGFFALIRPGFLWAELRHLQEGSAEMKEAQHAAMEGALAFWHSLGFRRVGTSSWLAWTDSQGHPSRQLAIANDAKCSEDRAAGDTLSDEMGRIFQRLFDKDVEPATYIEELTKTFPEDFDDEQWEVVDENANTLLHIAAVSWKPEVVRFLISKVPRLAAMRNKPGHTPLEAIRDQLELGRTRRSFGDLTWIESDRLQGFRASSTACLAALEQTTLPDLSGLSQGAIDAISSFTDAEARRSRSQLDVAGIRKALRYKYGCTCGQCTGGFLSPRMRQALLAVAEVEHDGLCTSMDDTGPGWVSWNEDLLVHLPERVRQNLRTNKSMRQGFANMFDHFASCLRDGRLPTEASLLRFLRDVASEWPPVTRNYLDRGGSVAAVADAIFERAMGQDEWAGEGSYLEIFGGEDMDALVPCRNDHEFGFVAGMCGYRRVTPGPRLVDMFGRELGPD